MTRKVAARGRKTVAGRSGRTARLSSARATSRAASRTGKKTASARATHPVAGVLERQSAPARRAGVRAPVREAAPDESRIDQIRTAHVEDDEDLDWLKEDEDPRSQIVEGDDEWEPNHEEEW